MGAILSYWLLALGISTCRSIGKSGAGAGELTDRPSAPGTVQHPA
jgi:hypothetical protein